MRSVESWERTNSRNGKARNEHSPCLPRKPSGRRHRVLGDSSRPLSDLYICNLYIHSATTIKSKIAFFFRLSLSLSIFFLIFNSFYKIMISLFSSMYLYIYLIISLYISSSSPPSPRFSSHRRSLPALHVTSSLCARSFGNSLSRYPLAIGAPSLNVHPHPIRGTSFSPRFPRWVFEILYQVHCKDRLLSRLEF